MLYVIDNILEIIQEESSRNMRSDVTHVSARRERRAMQVELLYHTPDPERAVATAARLCYAPVGASELMETLDAMHEALRGVTVPLPQLLEAVEGFLASEAIKG